MKKLFALLAFLLALGAIASAATLEEDQANLVKYRSDIDEGIGLLRTASRDEIHRSIAKFKSALKLQPESAEAYYWLALAYSDLNNYLRAADNAKDATTYDPRLAEAWSLWGQVLLYQKEWSEALNKLETAAQLSPEDPVILYNLGRVQYHGFRDPDAALAKFRTAWQIGQARRRDNPEMIAMTVRSRLYMGACEYDRGMRQDNMLNFDNAINAFMDVIREQPSNYDAQLRLALALRKAGRSGESERMLNTLLRTFEQSGESVDRQMRAEINLQLADLYLQDPQVRNRMLALTHLAEFVNLMGDSSHPALEPAREYLALNDEMRS